MLQQETDYPAALSPKVEKTLAIIKPDAVSHEDDIIVRIQKASFTITNRRKVKLTMEQAADFYAEHMDRPFFQGLCEFMSSGPVIVFVLSKENAIQEWRNLLGPTNSATARETQPTSLRALYGTDQQRNACHGSDSEASAERETRFFFPNTTFQPLPSKENARAFLEAALYPTLNKGLTELCKEKPENPTAWLGQWLLQNNPNKPLIIEPQDDD